MSGKKWPALLLLIFTLAVGCGEDNPGGQTAPVIAPPPTVTFFANPSSINKGETSTLTWVATHAVSCVAPNGSAATAGSWTTPVLTQSATYYISCNGPGGTISEHLTVIVCCCGAGGTSSGGGSSGSSGSSGTSGDTSSGGPVNPDPGGSSGGTTGGPVNPNP